MLDIFHYNVLFSSQIRNVWSYELHIFVYIFILLFANIMNRKAWMDVCLLFYHVFYQRFKIKFDAEIDYSVGRYLCHIVVLNNTYPGITFPWGKKSVTTRTTPREKLVIHKNTFRSITFQFARRNLNMELFKNKMVQKKIEILVEFRTLRFCFVFYYMQCHDRK